LRKLLIELCILAVASAIVAAAINRLREEPYPIRVPEGFYGIESGASPLLLAGAQRHFDEGESVFLDARTSEHFEECQIEGAMNVPFERWEELFPAVEPWIEDRQIVLYAGREMISLADDLAGAIASRGLDEALFIYLGGIEEWRETEMPIATGPDPLLEEKDEEDLW